MTRVKSGTIQPVRRCERAELYYALNPTFRPLASESIHSRPASYESGPSTSQQRRPSDSTTEAANEIENLRSELENLLQEKNALASSLLTLETSRSDLQRRFEDLREATSSEITELKEELSQAQVARDHLERIQASLVPTVKDFTKCCICSEVACEPLTTLKCGHFFCKECLDQWLEQPRPPRCPYCRSFIHKLDQNIAGIGDLLAEARKL